MDADQSDIDNVALDEACIPLPKGSKGLNVRCECLLAGAALRKRCPCLQLLLSAAPQPAGGTSCRAHALDTTCRACCWSQGCLRQASTRTQSGCPRSPGGVFPRTLPAKLQSLLCWSQAAGCRCKKPYRAHFGAKYNLDALATVVADNRSVSCAPCCIPSCFCALRELTAGGWAERAGSVSAGST